MKRSFAILLTGFIVLGILASAAVPVERKSKKKGTPDITGTWQLESYRHNTQMSDFTTVPPTRVNIKLITDNSFLWVSYETNNKTVTSSAGGKYTLVGDQYTEKIEYGLGMDSYLGSESTFSVRVEDGMMFITGSLSTGQKIEEIWQKVK